MTLKSNIAVIAAFITAMAGPAFAGDQNVNTELRDSGRFVRQVNEPAHAPAGAYATVNPVHVKFSAQADDFQLEGR
jgi:hypothetical protein